MTTHEHGPARYGRISSSPDHEAARRLNGHPASHRDARHADRARTSPSIGRPAVDHASPNQRSDVIQFT